MIITYHAPATLKAFAIGKALEHGGHGQNASDPKGLADKDPHEMTQEELVLHLAHLRRELDARMVDVSPDTAPDNADRKRVVWGKSGAVRVDVGGRRYNKKKTKKKQQ